MNLIKPKEIEVKDRKYFISKFPAIEGREIMRNYAIQGAESEDNVFKLMKYVAVELPNGNQVTLQTKDLVNNHVESWAALMKIEGEILAYNNDPLDEGRLLSSSGATAQNSQA